MVCTLYFKYNNNNKNSNNIATRTETTNKIELTISYPVDQANGHELCHAVAGHELEYTV